MARCYGATPFSTVVRHRAYEEAFYILDGTVRFKLGADDFHASQGSTVVRRDRRGSPDGGEVELRIGDAALALGDEFPEGVVTRASVYVYVENADATYRLALRNGATPIFPPEDKPYQERAGGVRDDFGNVWYISTYLGAGDAAPQP